jgi:uncharacterized membrane protein
VFICLPAGSFGMTLGRVLRLNSWSFVTNPSLLIHSFEEFSNPQTFHHLMGLTALLASFLILAYLALMALMAMGRYEEPLLDRHRPATSPAGSRGHWPVATSQPR